MRRKKKHPEHVNHERWLVSYADFITLLFAFFVVMFASSQADKGRAQQVSDAVKKALEGDKVGALIAAIVGGSPVDKGKGTAQKKGDGGPKQNNSGDARLAELLPSLEVLSQELAEEIEAGEVQIAMEPRGLVISFRQAALFPSGEDVVSPDLYPGLQKVGNAIGKIPNPVRLEGHTDSRPISTQRFRNNWDLSAARGIALLDIMTTRFGVPADRFSVAGYAETAPVDSNESDAGRARNRRVDIVVLNEQGAMGEPLKYDDIPPPQTAPPTAH